MKPLSSNQRRQKRHLRMRQQIIGTPMRPRLHFFRSHKYVYCQIIDDEKRVTLAAASSQKLVEFKNKASVTAAAAVGTAIAAAAAQQKIKTVVFDRSGYLYHGKVKAFAEAARKGGLEF